MSTNEHIQKTLRSAGFRATPSRMLLLSTLHNTPHTLSELKKILKNKMHQATIYRAIEELVGAGVLKKNNFPKQETGYEFSDHHHHHIVCEDCGTVEDITVCIPPSSAKKVLTSSKRFKDIRSHTLEFFGTCRSCSH